MPWWNIQREAGYARRAAHLLGRWRRGITSLGNVAAITKAIDEWGIDIVHSGTALTRGGALAAFKRGLPHVWHIKESIGRENRVQFSLSDRELVKYIGSLSTRVVAMSEYVASIFRRHGCRNVTVVPDGVDMEPYVSHASCNLRASLGLAANQRLVGMVASLTSTWKRHEVFVRTVHFLTRELPEAQFVVIGAKPSPTARWPYDLPLRYYRAIVRLAGEYVPDGRLKFLDSVPDPPDIMHSLDVLVHCCEIEPFGRVAIEAMAAGTPVVGPKAGGVSETVIDGQTGLLVAPGDPAAFADAIKRLIKDDELRQRLGRAASVHVQRHYTVDRQIARLASIYTDVLEHKRG